MKAPSRLAATDRWRTGLVVLIGFLLLGHIIAPEHVTLDRSGVFLILVLTLLVLAPSLISAKLPGAPSFNSGRSSKQLSIWARTSAPASTGRGGTAVADPGGQPS